MGAYEDHTQFIHAGQSGSDFSLHEGLGDVAHFDKEITFGIGGSVSHTHNTFVYGISGLAVESGGLENVKLLFNEADFGKITGTANAVDPSGAHTAHVGTSAFFQGKHYQIFLRKGWHGATFALIDENRLSTQFVFNSAGASVNFVAVDSLNIQTLSAGHHGNKHHPVVPNNNNAISAKVRRLWNLGYI